ncbi:MULTISPECIES: helix-turn-helix transcriptional regulator [unclassified Streptomyces]|uniref:helix-turn-helix domain-containing protein n=1 Tax=unclassified Streptomyces TaxID=2593676 RepID=UPI002DD951C6|nr:MULTISPECIES: helix-turn-helix transcriptional regulator [unclassified Streptomyces]WSA93317.1 helix-turn-helix domain-containing protein [Streptomyces sp. NBC_01795]WSB77705.1 helix-turn-helix domain-containing protein [Streptomyces sp. NBC_01775]WSS14046.1 helix-turn-helix domain-containing protein [Streptomyces sp. NBC_01186]WSS42865.1 helix-turn-helix domain-containing protein [Streptomyces sp. NBC_01187]
MITDIESATPALCRLQLGSELRQLRLAAGFNGRTVVRKLLWSPSKLTRLETGENVAVEPSDVIALCEIYGATPEKRAMLQGYAAVTKTRRDWWQSAEYRPVIRPGFKAYLGLEATASVFQNYASEFVPGLLQTEAYVRVIHERAHQGMSTEEVDSLVAVRMNRQEVLWRKDSPLKLTAIINEAVLHRTVGGSQVMRDQLGHIVDVATSFRNVRVQVVPFSSGAHPGMNGSFVVLQFPDRAAMRSLVYLENMADVWISRREGDVERYEEAFTDLQALAPGPQESLSLIKKAVKEH